MLKPCELYGMRNESGNVPVQDAKQNDESQRPSGSWVLPSMSGVSRDFRFHSRLTGSAESRHRIQDITLAPEISVGVDVLHFRDGGIAQSAWRGDHHLPARKRKQSIAFHLI